MVDGLSIDSLNHEDRSSHYLINIFADKRELFECPHVVFYESRNYFAFIVQANFREPLVSEDLFN